MKIIEAMKRIKMNNEKVQDLQMKIATNAAQLSIETPNYSDQREQVRGWLQACEDISKENIRLLVAIQRTNLSTPVTIELGGKQVTKSIAEWVWRRRQYAAQDMLTWSKLTDQGKKEGISQVQGGGTVTITLIRHFDPEKRDEKVSLFRSEPHIIDSALEITNATTDLLEE